MTRIQQNLDRVRSQILHAELAAGRARGSVRLLAVSKTKPASDLAEAYQAGQRHFGESYVQEALVKQRALAGFAITWHFIGPIQSNKTKQIAGHFDWVHSVDRFRIAKRLSDQRPGYLPPLNICLQVNISGEESKSGIKPEQLEALVSEVAALPNLRLRGVMAIPEPETDYQWQCRPYRALSEAVERLAWPGFDTFSFGMSEDLKAAIAEGSTIVRIGSAIFGARTY